MYSYRIYGLGVQSYLRLPGLEETPVSGPDVRIRRDDVDTSWVDYSERLGHVRAGDGAITYVYDSVGALSIHEGREVVFDPAPDASEALLAYFVLGKALGVALYQRGHLVLHASSAVVDGRGVAFLGGPGWGKSTAAGAAYARGHRVIADDVTPVFFDGSPSTRPAFPVLKLEEEAARALADLADPARAGAFESPVASPPEIDKGLYRLDDFTREPAGLERIYVLADGAEGEAARVESLSPREAHLELVRHTYAVYLLEGSDGLDDHFRQSAELARSVPVQRIHRSPVDDGPGGLADLLEADLSDGTAESVADP